MADFLLLMKGTQPSDGWEDYINRLIDSGLFRGGSAFGNSIGLQKSDATTNADTGSLEIPCTVTGFMRFEAETRAEVEALIAGNPVFESGDAVELHELVTG